MANAEQLSALGQGLEAWNEWRIAHPEAPIDLSGTDLRHLEFGLLPALRKADKQRGTIPKGVSWPFIYNEIVGWEFMPLNLRDANLRHSNLDSAELIKAECQGADFSGATLRATNLHRADLSSAKFVDADVSGADLRGANLSKSLFVGTNVDGADLGYSDVYGISVWGLRGVPRDETGLLVTPFGEPVLRTDGLALAQLIYFLMRNEHAKDLIDTLTNRLVLILGNFKEERKAVLDEIRTALRGIGFMPMIFDFEGPKGKDTDPRSVPHELATTVPFLRTTPVVLLQEKGATGYSMASDLEAYPWVLGIYQYETSKLLVCQLPEIVQRARATADSLQDKSAVLS